MMSHDQVQTIAQGVELRQQIDRLTRKLDYLYRELSMSYPDDDVPTYVIEAREYVLQGRDADAVKIVREHTAVGILEAREIVEDLRRRLARSNLPSQEVTNAFADVPEAARQSSSASAW
jgi:hypothetical protein